MALSRAKGFAAGEGMPESSSKLTRYRFGPFDLDPGEGTLARHGIRVRLQDLPYRLLVMLVERSGEVVTREEMRQHLWPQNTFVEFDNSLGVAIRKVRESLNDNADAPQYVETIPRRGYRFVAPVIVETPGEPLAIELQSQPVHQHQPGFRPTVHRLRRNPLLRDARFTGWPQDWHSFCWLRDCFSDSIQGLRLSPHRLKPVQLRQ